MKEFASALSAVNWYGKNGRDQYEGKNLATYDYAAATLTRREDYAKHLLSEIGDNPGKILEIASGTGLISRTLSNSFPSVVYTDYAGDSMGLLQERTASGDIAQASFYDLPFKSHSFDTILNVGGYRYVSRDHMLTFWDEMDRVLRPGGKLIIGQFYPRIKSLEGTNIQHDIRLIPQSFTLESTTSFDAKLGPAYVKLRSGTYKTFAFRHTDTQVI